MLLAIPTFTAAANAPATLTPPTALNMTTMTGAPLVAGSWINTTRLQLHFQMQAATGPVVPQVEIEPLGMPFTGQPTFSGSPVSNSGAVTVIASGLTNGQRYHWQARIADSAGDASPWVTFAPAGTKTADFGIDRDPPARPIISSPTDPKPSRWYHNRVIVFRWSSNDPLSGIRGYAYVLERRAHVIPPGSISPANTLRLLHLKGGIWFLALRAEDNAGNWSPTATFKLQIDRRPVRIIWLSPKSFTYNPYKGKTSIKFRLSKGASVKLALYRVGSKHPTQTYSFKHVAAGKVVTVSWNGRDARGHFVPRGYYFFVAKAIDRAHNITHIDLGGIRVVPVKPQQAVTGQPVYPGDGKRIIVSLSRQTLYAYDGSHLVLQTYVTTGNPSLPTPLGSYTVMAKYHPFEFISPWPPGSPDYYPPSWVQYAMLFRQGGYFLHDAPWRSVFGPGSNGPGQPGTNYGGTHGCVNIPPNAMYFLWNWTPIGTAVDIVP